jgi:L-cysteine/cystine lyase
MGMPIDLPRVRSELPLLADHAYLNTGGTGPLPRPVADAIRAAVTAQLGMERMGPEGVEVAERVVADLRGAAGAVIGAAADDIAITANTTTGLDIVIWGIDWRPGDHIITTELEHPGMSVPIAVAARRHGLRVTYLTRAEAELDLEGAISRHVGPRTRLIGLSHVSWCTGALLDVAGAARAAVATDAIVLVDGAQAVGAVAVDVGGLGVDAYAFPAQKWLLGPEGLGALWAPAGTREVVELTFAAYEGGTGHQQDGSLELYPGARRYEISTPPLLLCHGWLAGLRWLEAIGWEEIYRATRDNQMRASSALTGVPGITVITPPGDQAGLVVFGVPGDPEAAFRRVLEAGACVRWLVAPPALRASLGFFASESDIDALRAGVRSLRP